MSLPAIQIQNCQIGFITSNLVGLLSVRSHLNNDFGFVAFTDLGPKGEIIVPKGISKKEFDIQQYILSSLKTDLVYEQQGELSNLLENHFEYTPQLLQGDIYRNLFMNGRILWKYQYEDELTLEMSSDVLPSDSRFVCKNSFTEK
jgi:D-alanyl-lipoteichoic acid acyltransferase DltB (MBOAT superfamily)